MSAITEIERAALALPLEQRVLLAESLLDSVPAAGEDWSEAEELAEVERREREIESGKVQPLAEAEFWKRIEKLFELRWTGMHTRDESSTRHRIASRLVRQGCST